MTMNNFGWCKGLMLSALLCILFSTTQAQHAPQTGCGTVDPELIPGFEERSAAFRIWMDEFRSRIAANKTAGNSPTASKYVIPTVVHVVYEKAADSVSIEQIKSQFVELFNDYRHVPGTRGFGGGPDTYIEFSLATKDPQGRPHSGVNYINSPLTNLSKDNNEVNNRALKTQVAPAWDNTMYLNVWLVKSITNPNGGDYPNIAGYAQFPDMTPRSTDGIVVINQDFGNKVGTAKGYSSTTSHELGHWCYLYHPFQGGAQGGCAGTLDNCKTQGDGVCDTPPVSSYQFKNPTVRLNTCPYPLPDASDNPLIYMDYTSQVSFDCNTFTPGQVERMAGAMENANWPHRTGLWQEDNIKATGAGMYAPPRANFSATKLTSCVGSPITFLDYSMNQATTFKWLFVGATPSESTDPAPTVNYTAAGKFAVTLIVGNESGVADTITKNNFITILDDMASLPFAEAFDLIGFPPKGWHIVNSDAGQPGGQTWTRTATTGGFADAKKNGCAQMTMGYYANLWQYDGFVTPAINTSGATRLALKFNLAYQPLSYENTTKVPISSGQPTVEAIRTLFSDTLSIYVSQNCGNSWDRVWYKGGTQLMTTNAPGSSNATGGGEFIFNARGENEWDSVQVDLNAYAGLNSILLKFETRNGFGNNLYIDDVAVIDSNMVSVSPLAQLKRFVSVAPNPFSGTTTLRLKDMPEAASLAVRVFDVQGREVYRTTPGVIAPGDHELELPLQQHPTGLYSIQVQVNDRLEVWKVIKE